MDCESATEMLSQKGKQLLVIDNFKFSLAHTSKSGMMRWRCWKRTCSAKIYTSTTSGSKVMDKIGIHNHEADNNIPRQAVSNSVKRKAIEEIAEKPSKLIYSELKNNKFSDEINTNDVDCIRRNMYTARRSILPPLFKSKNEDIRAVKSFKMNNLTNGNRGTPTKLSNGNSNIPLRKTSLNRVNSNSSTNSTPPHSPSRIPINNPEAQKWKQKYDDVDQKRKTILTEKEKIARQYNDMQKKHLDLQIKNEQLETELFEKNENYSRLSEASKNLYKEYETLKNKYETETTAMSKALQDASNWYKENKELKRKTMLFIDADAVDEGVDAGDCNGDSDIQNLQKTIKQLSAEVAELQTEVDTLKHIEFTTSEQNIKLTEELECEKDKNRKLDHDLNELKKSYEQMIRVSEMMKKELNNLKEMEENQRNNAVILRKEADDYKRERNVLAHQSTLLLQGLNNENHEELMVLLLDVEQLKRTVEDERNKHEEEMNVLQEKLEMMEKNPQVEVLEERLKLAESELQEALERAEKAEEALKKPPAPPPPPPPPITANEPPVVPLRVKRRSRANIAELADAIGVKDKEIIGDCKKAMGVNDNIINDIKSGKFTLRKVKNDSKKERDGSKAVSELLNILGSLRKAPKARHSQVVDVSS